MSHDYDVIVVGARVAGASTAMLLARSGHRVLVVDRAPMPSDTLSTHAILRTGVLQLSRWGVLDQVVAAGTPPVRNVTLGFGEERIPFQVRPDFGIDTLYAPRRHLLDAILVRAAVDAGAEFRERTRMTGLLRSGTGRVSGIELSRGTASEQLSARFVVGADGHKSRVAELVDAPMRAWHAATNAVHYAYYTGVEVTGFWFQFTPGVNAGLVPTNDGQCLVFTGRPVSRLGRFRADPDGEFGILLELAGADLARLVAGGRRVSEFRGTPGLDGFSRRAHGPGWVLVGDAGYTKDPISAHGISDALRDAELCARALDRALGQPDEEATALDRYEQTRDVLSRRMIEESRELARYQWGPDEASGRMRVVSAAVRSECEAILDLPRWSPVGSTMARV